MSETKTKNLCTVPAADLTDSQYFIAEDGGELKRIPKAQVVLKKLENMLATDTENLAGGGEVTAQELLDALAEQVANKLLAKSQVVNNLLATVEGNPLDATQGKALKNLIDTTNNNLSKRLLVGDNIASADLLNDNPAERFGTLSMRFSDGTMNQLLLLKDTAVVTILRNNVWTEQYRFATTSMLSDYVPKSDLVVSSSDIQSKQNITDDSSVKFYKYGKIVVAHISIKTTSNLSGYNTLKLGVTPNGFKPSYECRCPVLMQQTNVSRILSFTTYGDINLWNWSSDSSITTPSGSSLNGFAVYCVA